MSSAAVSLVGTTTAVKPSELNYFHRNPRRGDVDAIAGSLAVNGQYTPIIVNIGTHTGRPNEVLAGNHTLMAFRQLGEQHPFDTAWQLIKVHWCDVDEDKANRIVAVDNQAFELGEGTDRAVVYDLLKDLGDTAGTGFAEADLDALEKAFAPPDPPTDTDSEGEPQKPSLAHREGAIGFTLIFDDEEQQEAWFAWIRELNETYPDEETVGERLLRHLDDTASERI